MRELFVEFDPKSTGFIDVHVFEKLLNSIGLFPSKSILLQMMREVDIDGNGKIDDIEFIQFARTLLNDRRQHPKTELEDALKVSLRELEAIK